MQCLCVTDVQEGALTPTVDKLLPKILDMVGEFDWVQRKPIILTRFINTPESPFRRWLQYNKLITHEDRELWQFIRNIRYPIFTKTSYSIWTKALTQYLTHKKITEIYFAGIDTDACIYQSALAAFDHDIEPFVISDACASNAGDAVHEAALTLLRRNIGKDRVITRETIREMQ